MFFHGDADMGNQNAVSQPKCTTRPAFLNLLSDNFTNCNEF